MRIIDRKAVIIITTAFIFFCCKGEQNTHIYSRYSRFYIYEGDTIGKRFHIIGIPFDTTLYLDGGDAIIDVNGDGLLDNIGRMQRFTHGVSQDIIDKHINDTINQLSIYLNEGDSIFRYKTRSAFVLSNYYMGFDSIFANGNNGFCIRTEGRQSDWNRYYLYFKYDKLKDSFYLIKSLVQAEYESNIKKIVEEKTYNENTKIPFEKVNFDVYFEHLLNAIPQPEDWRSIVVEKSIIYNDTFQPTKQYFIKDDNVRIDNEKDNFYQITYFTETKKIIKGWVKKDDVSEY